MAPKKIINIQDSPTMKNSLRSSCPVESQINKSPSPILSPTQSGAKQDTPVKKPESSSRNIVVGKSDEVGPSICIEFLEELLAGQGSTNVKRHPFISYFHPLCHPNLYRSLPRPNSTVLINTSTSEDGDFSVTKAIGSKVNAIQVSLDIL